MANGDWQDQVAAERMQVDQEFDERVRNSELTGQQWGLVMTAAEFDIENPENPDRARLVPDLSSYSAIADELERVEQATAMGSPGEDSSSGGELLSGVKEALGLGSDENDPYREEAERLAEEYAQLLQQKLTERGRWATICERAQG
ncbi:MAG: DUF5799 family protein [Haloarculaceae archaeon]